MVSRVMFWFLVSPLFFSLSCTKEKDENGDGDTYLYYDYYSDIDAAPNQQTNTYLTSSRVCYNITRDQVAWEKPNEVIMPYRYADDAEGGEYSKTFLRGEYLVKIFVSCDVPTRIMANNGIYFQKISKKTGDAVISKKIIAPGEFNAGDGFAISSVVTDGTNFIFACNNDCLYAFDENGNQVWKKSNYKMGNVKYTSPTANYPGFSYIYYNDKKIFFIVKLPSGNKALVCLDASNGNELWQRTANWDAGLKKIFFCGDRVLDISDYGWVLLANKNTGEITGSSAPPAAPVTGYARPIGAGNDRYAIYFTRNNNIAHVQLAMPDVATVTYLTNIRIDEKFIIDNGMIYGMNRNAGVFEFCGINWENGVNWKKTGSWAPSVWPGVGFNELYNYQLKNNSLYLVTSFGFNGSSLVNNEIRKIIFPGSAPPVDIPYPGVVIMDYRSGNVSKYCKKIPVGTYSSTLYRFVVE